MEREASAERLRTNPERSPGDFAVIETRRAIEPRHDVGKCGTHAPLVGAPARLLERAAPSSPPTCGAARNRLDDEDAVAMSGALDQLGQQPVANRVVQLVECERREYRVRGWFQFMTCGCRL